MKLWENTNGVKGNFGNYKLGKRVFGGNCEKYRYLYDEMVATNFIAFYQCPCPCQFSLVEVAPLVPTSDLIYICLKPKFPYQAENFGATNCFYIG